MKIKILLITFIGINFGVIAQNETVNGNIEVKKSQTSTNYPSQTSRGDIFQLYQNWNSTLEIGVGGNQNTRRSWILSRHGDLSGSYGKYYSTLHLQPDTGDKSQYRGIAIGYNANQHIGVGTHLAVNGHVGIGTISPSSPLDIEKNQDGDVLLEVTNLNTGTKARSGIIVGKSDGNRTFLFSTSNNYNGVSSWKNSGVIGTDSGLLGGLVIRTSTGKIRFQPKGITDKMVLDENGNLGIGTTETGTHKLAVHGTIGAREIVVETGAWSDFVFNNDYELKDLEEVESFIEENNHLPDVPSEKEVLENGIALGEMDAKLLQKIEELTLYMIEQNKMMKAQSKEIENLKVEIKTLKSL